MKTYLTIWFDSEGAGLVEVVDRQSKPVSDNAHIKILSSPSSHLFGHADRKI